MASGYEPPSGTNLPFNFTDSGYTAPTAADLRYNFLSVRGGTGNLQAAINVMQPYWYTTHTYTKSCPKYVVGYGSGRVQIIKGRCLYGGIRDLQGLITGIAIDYKYDDLPASITGRKKSGSGDLGAFLARAFKQENLPASAAGHYPADISALLRPMRSGNSDLAARGGGHLPANLSAAIDKHDPSNLSAYVDVLSRSSRNLTSYIYGWQASDLGGRLNIVFPKDLPATLFPVRPADLPAYLKPTFYRNLYASMRAFDIAYLGAYIKRIYDVFLPAQINAISDNYKNLPVVIQIHGEGYADLTSYIKAFKWSTLSASLIPKYIANLQSYLFPVLPKDIRGHIHGWQEANLQGILNVAVYPWNLTASIYPYGVFSNLGANISPARAIYQSRDLRMSVHTWEQRNLGAYMFAANAVNLSAYLEPYMQASDIHASIYPKMIRLTTLVKIPTMVARDMSATINYLCFHTGVRNLPSYIWATYKGDLFAYIKGRIPYNQPTDLGAKIGYSDSYLVQDKYKISIAVRPSKYFVQDVYKIKMFVLAAGNVLNAYIRPTPRYRNITASLTGIDIDPYIFSGLFKNREKVIHKTYDGVFEAFETVEMAFKSAVKEYYYSAVGNVAWKASRFDRWMLDVRSILPTNLATRLKRRLHRITTVYDFTRFATVDEAIRYAIAHVTEWPQGNLGATIYNRSRYEQLSAVINARYVKHATTGMSASITSLQDTVIVDRGTDISIIRN